MNSKPAGSRYKRGISGGQGTEPNAKRLTEKIARLHAQMLDAASARTGAKRPTTSRHK